MAELNLTYVDELVRVRKELHGGNRGAPKKVDDGSREGASINRSCVVMLSALLQAYIEEVFQLCAKRALPNLTNDQVWDNYWKQMKGWGNPSASNAKSLFLKIGVEDIFSGLSWQKCDTDTVRSKLNELNQIRNSIAHGAAKLRVNNADFTLSLANVENLRNFAESFGIRFEAHALSKV